MMSNDEKITIEKSLEGQQYSYILIKSIERQADDAFVPAVAWVLRSDAVASWVKDEARHDRT
jgi:hypothetical protein